MSVTRANLTAVLGNQELEIINVVLLELQVRIYEADFDNVNIFKSLSWFAVNIPHCFCLQYFLSVRISKTQLNIYQQRKALSVKNAMKTCFFIFGVPLASFTELLIVRKKKMIGQPGKCCGRLVSSKLIMNNNSQRHISESISYALFQSENERPACDA